jgi:hypothetical protein
MIFGLEGLVKLVYQGKASAMYVGKCTETKYEVNPEKPAKWIDKRDVAGLLALHTASGERMFVEWLAS